MDRIANLPMRQSPRHTTTPQAPISSCEQRWETLLHHRQVAPPQKVGTLAKIDRFEILQQLGSGGMGIVFLARDPLGISATDPSSDSGFVAIKTPFPELVAHPRSRERFLTEARHLQQFDHPNILKVLEIQTSPTPTSSCPTSKGAAWPNTCTT